MECSFPLTCFCHTNWKRKTKAGVPRAWLGQKQKRTWKQGLREMPDRNGRHYYLTIRLRIAVRLLLPRMRTHRSFLLPVSGSSLSSIFEIMMQRQSVLFICFSMAAVTAFGMDFVCLDNPSTASPTGSSVVSIFLIFFLVPSWAWVASEASFFFQGPQRASHSEQGHREVKEGTCVGGGLSSCHSRSSEKKKKHLKLFWGSSTQYLCPLKKIKSNLYYQYTLGCAAFHWMECGQLTRAIFL